MIELLKSIPKKWRRGLYFGYVLVGFVLGGIHLALVTAGVADPDPTWLDVTDKLVQYIGLPIGIVAGVNVGNTNDPVDPEA